ncbi:hypothetical protein DRJ22_01435 [Candidatus Woesearchaeota archaeon]|nr:MAG: hypothetical protein B6U93_00785 [Candidatus Woesearchaeota archaeon ex4484_78]RLE46664.1 MAG: hypothetical protein DRJ22_01435 [Candidatus Woesearchaeota archaeon]
MSPIQQAVELLQEVGTDTGIPKNIKTKIAEIVKLLNAQEETSLRISKALSELEKLTEDINVEPYTRSQLFNVASILEIV